MAVDLLGNDLRIDPRVNPHLISGSNSDHMYVRQFLRDIPVVRSINRSGPKYHVGSVFENKAGSQILRVLFKHCLWRIRAGVPGNDILVFASQLDQDGVLVIENFLSDDAFEAVCNEYESVIGTFALKPYKDVDEGYLYRTQVPLSKGAERLVLIEKHFRNNQFLNSIASFVIRRKIRMEPEVFLDRYKSVTEEGVDNDIENILHADLHIPTVKMFYYLNQVTEENGAFVYAKGSHRLSLARLRHEYDLSIREAKLKAGLPVAAHLLETRANETRNIVDPENYKRMGLVETSINVKPNTLVVANNMGFHRRGEFKAGRERKALLIIYRNAERSLL